MQQEGGAVRQQLVVLRAHQRQRVKTLGIGGGLRHAVAEPVEGCAGQLEEQRLLSPEHPEHVSLRDACLVRDRLDRCAVQPVIRELTRGDPQYLGPPLRSAHPHSHVDQVTSY